MKIPTKLRVSGIDYNIKYSTTLGDNVLGLTDLDTNTISLGKSLTQEQKEITLFHELFHCINWELSESECEFLSHAIYAILKDNNLLTKK